MFHNIHLVIILQCYVNILWRSILIGVYCMTGSNWMHQTRGLSAFKLAHGCPCRLAVLNLNIVSHNYIETVTEKSTYYQLSIYLYSYCFITRYLYITHDACLHNRLLKCDRKIFQGSLRRKIAFWPFPLIFF